MIKSEDGIWLSEYCVVVRNTFGREEKEKYDFLS
jgi:hypothetical protein